MRILITGAQGQLAHDLQTAFSGQELTLLSREELDIRDVTQVETAVGAARPDVVVNTAAFVRVDDAEDEIAQSFAVNAGGAGHVARACANTGATLVQISTDYVYGGQQQREPLTEENPPSPLNVYGASKLGGECAVQVLCPHHYLVRTCGLYGVAGVKSRNGNFVQTMLRLARTGRTATVVDDQHCTPTATADLAQAVRELVAAPAPFGLYHVTNAGQTTWYEFAQRTFELAGLSPDLSPISTEAFGAPAKRPPYSVLSSGRYAQVVGEGLPAWEDALERYLQATRAEV
ncbi:MAG: dTDP-4-dehydrorhamnose reductase [Dehalococcoidia bacterium]|nr:dTDP-4-dehydrorhamnose reductase [Dehalococcoidia bacterium]